MSTFVRSPCPSTGAAYADTTAGKPAASSTPRTTPAQNAPQFRLPRSRGTEMKLRGAVQTQTRDGCV
jgi:hypothetical protein